MKRVARNGCIVLLVLFCAGCGTGKVLDKADVAVANFHSQLNAGNFQQIYADSDDSFKSATSQEKFVAILEAVHRKLGLAQSTDRKSFFVNLGTAGGRVDANYSTRFDSDTAQEHFVFRTAGEGVRLVGYHINSDVLITQ